jgi:APA family basic amino acid/polyamine antiporter
MTQTPIRSAPPAARVTGQHGTTPAKTPSADRFGLSTASALVVGSVIGTGVFALPCALAPNSPVSLVAFGLLTVAAIASALAFGALNRRLPGLLGVPFYVWLKFGRGEHDETPATTAPAEAAR